MARPQPGERVLDIGCGSGDTTIRIGGLVGPEGEAVGVDAAPRMIETAERDARDAGAGNVRFMVADIQADDLGGPYDMAFSRLGDDVLRESGGRPAQRARVPASRRTTRDGGLAPA